MTAETITINAKGTGCVFVEQITLPTGDNVTSAAKPNPVSKNKQIFVAFFIEVATINY